MPARPLFRYLFEKYGTWDLVALAWYTNEKTADQAKEGGKQPLNICFGHGATFSHHLPSPPRGAAGLVGKYTEVELRNILSTQLDDHGGTHQGDVILLG